MAVNKPSGLLVHRTLIDRYATQFALQMVRDQVGQHVYPIHRLDKATSGILIFALSREAAQAMAQKFAQAIVYKKYLAIVRGWVLGGHEVDHPLHGRPAQTTILGVQCFAIPILVDRYPVSRYSLVEARPKSGRTHQIRRHLGHLSHPIIGDVTYGVGRHNRFFRDEFHIRRLLLACTQVEFSHPVTQSPCQIKAPLAAPFVSLLESLKKYEVSCPP